MKVDVICPIYFINEHFEENVESWFKELPIKTLIVGRGKENGLIKEILGKYSNVKLINQTHYKSLGYCIKELVSFVGTEWFVFLHDDVKLLDGWFENMWREVELYKGDIYESLKEITSKERINQAYSWRPYSGAQLIRKEVYDLVMEDIDDDFLYTTEDIVFCIRALHQGYSYYKVPIFHEHQGNRIYERSKERLEVLLMQAQAIVKYCPRIPLMEEMLKGTLDSICKEIKERWARNKVYKV